LTAGGLGGVLFGAGIAICFFAYKAAPRIDSTDRPSPPPGRRAGSGGGGPETDRIQREYTDKLYLQR